MKIGRFFRQIVDRHPRLDRAAHIFHKKLVHTVGIDRGQAVQHLEIDRRRGPVGQTHFPGKRGQRFAGNRKILDHHLQPQGLIHLTDHQLVRTDFHPLGGRVSRRDRRLLKRFIKNGFPATGNFKESTETQGGDLLIGLIRREKFQNRAVFIPDAETRDALPAIDIKDPHRCSKKAGDPRQKIAEWLLIIVLLNDKTSIRRQLIAGLV